MSSKVTIIDGVTVVNITPELSPEERKKRVREIAEGLIAIGKKRKKDKLGSVTTELNTLS